MLLRVLVFAALLVPAGTARAQGDACDQPQPVCEARAAVFAISAFDPVGSAVRLDETRLVTARHVVADDVVVTVLLPDGQRLAAEVIPTDYPGDLVLLEARNLPPGPVLAPAKLDPASDLFTVGADVGLRRIRAYDPGRLTFAPAPDHPLARLHHSAYSQPGNSGGALVDEEGRLVGIVASGGEGRFEAVPAEAIAEVAARSGPDAAADSAELGAASGSAPPCWTTSVRPAPSCRRSRPRPSRPRAGAAAIASSWTWPARPWGAQGSARPPSASSKRDLPRTPTR
jgi:hypothetical protein